MTSQHSIKKSTSLPRNKCLTLRAAPLSLNVPERLLFKSLKVGSGPIGGSDHLKPNVPCKLFAAADRLQMPEFLYIDSRYFRALFEQSFGDLQGQRFNSHFSQIIGGKALRAVKF